MPNAAAFQRKCVETKDRLFRYAHLKVHERLGDCVPFFNTLAKGQRNCFIRDTRILIDEPLSFRYWITSFVK